jgi:hypothetical protein
MQNVSSPIKGHKFFISKKVVFCLSFFLNILETAVSNWNGLNAGRGLGGVDKWIDRSGFFQIDPIANTVKSTVVP